MAGKLQLEVCKYKLAATGKTASRVDMRYQNHSGPLWGLMQDVPHQVPQRATVSLQSGRDIK